jgi:hypothetical protein
MAKSSIATKVKDWSNGLLIGVTTIVLVVGLIVGFGLGFKVEQGRIRTKNKKSALVAGKKTRKKVVLPAAVRAIGDVSATTANIVTITPAKGPARRFVLGKGSLIVKASRGSVSDVVSGARMTYKPGGQLRAKEIVVLRGAQARMGVLLTGATPTSMTFTVGAKRVTINTSGAAVDTVATGTKSDITKGAKVIVQGRRIKTGALVVTEIVVLPSNSAFV